MRRKVNSKDTSVDSLDHLNANLSNLIRIKSVQYANNDCPYKLAVGHLTDIHVYSCCGFSPSQ